VAIAFNGTPIPGWHERIAAAKPMLQTKRTKFAGINGESEIVLGTGGRALECKIWINSPSFGSSQSLAQFLAQLDGLVGSHGPLVETGSVQQTFNDVTYEGFVPSGPYLPVVGGVGMNAGTWFVEGTLHFYQDSIV